MTDHNTCVNTSPTTNIVHMPGTTESCQAWLLSSQAALFLPILEAVESNHMDLTRLHSCTIVCMLVASPLSMGSFNLKSRPITEVNQVITYNIQQRVVITVYNYEVQRTDGSEVALLSWAICSQKVIIVFLIHSRLS